ncbi:MAG: hypothetical protein WC373_17160 [Smithella sp.]|jgi:hypothetical protein
MRIGSNSPIISWSLCACFSVVSIVHLLAMALDGRVDFGFIRLSVVSALIALLFGVLALRATRNRKRHHDGA